MSFNESKYQFPLKTPSQSFTGKISRLLSAVAILDHIDIAVLTTRGEACHGILSRLRLPTAQLSATHDNLRVATLLRYGCHRLTMICASLTLLQIMFAGANCVRCCDSRSLATARNAAVLQRTAEPGPS